MITREDIEKVHTSLAQAELFYRLLIERDEALYKLAAVTREKEDLYRSIRAEGYKRLKERPV